jgi:hypothetical protein
VYARERLASLGTGAELAAAAATARTQRLPYLAAHAALTQGESALTVEFGAPAPLGLLQTNQ